MPSVRRAFRSGDQRRGGTLGYPSEELNAEVAFIAYYMHWPFNEIMALEHRERRLWVAEISKINERLNSTERPGPERYVNW